MNIRSIKRLETHEILRKMDELLEKYEQLKVVIDKNVDILENILVSVEKNIDDVASDLEVVFDEDDKQKKDGE